MQDHEREIKEEFIEVRVKKEHYSAQLKKKFLTEIKKRTC